jgi:hypothetical protein
MKSPTRSQKAQTTLHTEATSKRSRRMGAGEELIDDRVF